MGHSSSSNVATSTTNALMKVVNTTTQQCVSPVTQSQGLTVNATGGSIINVGAIDWSQVVTIQSNCALSNTTENNLSTSLLQTAAQQATTTNSALGLDIGSQAANNITNYTTNLATAVTNAYTGQCGILVNQSQAASFSASNGSVLNVGSLNWKQTQSDVTSCIMSNSDVTTASQNLQQAVNQVAKSSISGLFFLILFIIIGVVVLAIIGAVIFFIMKQQKQAKEFVTSPEGQQLLKTAAMVAAPEVAIPAMAASSAAGGGAGGKGGGLGGLTSLLGGKK